MLREIIKDGNPCIFNTDNISHIERDRFDSNKLFIVISKIAIKIEKSQLSKLKLDSNFFKYKDKIVNMRNILYINIVSDKIQICLTGGRIEFNYVEKDYLKIIKHYRRVTSGWSMDYRG